MLYVVVKLSDGWIFVHMYVSVCVGEAGPVSCWSPVAEGGILLINIISLHHYEGAWVGQQVL